MYTYVYKYLKHFYNVQFKSFDCYDKNVCILLKKHLIYVSIE